MLGAPGAAGVPSALPAVDAAPPARCFTDKIHHEGWRSKIFQHFVLALGASFCLFDETQARPCVSNHLNYTYQLNLAFNVPEFGLASQVKRQKSMV